MDPRRRCRDGVRQLAVRDGIKREVIRRHGWSQRWRGGQPLLKRVSPWPRWPSGRSADRAQRGATFRGFGAPCAGSNNRIEGSGAVAASEYG